MSSNIENKVVVITGASSGLGEATARLLSTEGAIVVVGARHHDPGRSAPAQSLREPIGRFGEPVEIASAVVWLCGPTASFMIGHALAVDGGVLAQ